VHISVARLNFYSFDWTNECKHVNGAVCHRTRRTKAVIPLVWPLQRPVVCARLAHPCMSLRRRTSRFHLGVCFLLWSSWSLLLADGMTSLWMPPGAFRPAAWRQFLITSSPIAGGNGALGSAASLSAYAPWQVGGGGHCYTLMCCSSLTSGLRMLLRDVYCLR
jgi:hypothetical protein